MQIHRCWGHIEGTHGGQTNDVEYVRKSDADERISSLEAQLEVRDAANVKFYAALSQIERLTHEGGPDAVYRIACNAMFGLLTPAETKGDASGL